MLFGEMIGFWLMVGLVFFGLRRMGRRQWAPDSSSDPPVQPPARVALAKEHWNKLIRLRRITGAGHPELRRRSSGTRGEPGRPPGPA